MRFVPSYPHLFVTEFGEVFRYGIRRVSPAINSRGYICVNSTAPNAKTVTVHSLVAEAFIGPRPTGLQINHKDGNKTNNHFSNLEYVTRQYNMQHASSTGLMPRMFTAEEALSLRVKFARGESASSLARKHGTGHAAMCELVNGTTYKDVPMPEGGEG